MRLFMHRALLLVALPCVVPGTVRAQLANDRVRVHLAGVRLVDDSVVGWTRDSLYLRRTVAIARREMTGLDVWRPRSFSRTALLYGNIALAVLQMVDVETDKDRPNYGVPVNVGAHLAVSAGVGLGVALLERVRRRGRWVPVLTVSP
jgi:hypothetical protein